MLAEPMTGAVLSILALTAATAPAWLRLSTPRRAIGIVPSSPATLAECPLYAELVRPVLVQFPVPILACISPMPEGSLNPDHVSSTDAVFDHEVGVIASVGAAGPLRSILIGIDREAVFPALSVASNHNVRVPSVSPDTLTERDPLAFVPNCVLAPPSME